MRGELVDATRNFIYLWAIVFVALLLLEAVAFTVWLGLREVWRRYREKAHRRHH